MVGPEGSPQHPSPFTLVQSGWQGVSGTQWGWRSGNRTGWLERPEVEMGDCWMQEPPVRSSGRQHYRKWHHDTQETRGDQSLSVGNWPAKSWWETLVRNSTSCKGRDTIPSTQPWLCKHIALMRLELWVGLIFTPNQLRPIYTSLSQNMLLFLIITSMFFFCY